MFRIVCILMSVGLVAALGCGRKPADQPAKKATGEDVRRDAGRAAKTAVEYSRQSAEKFQKKVDKELAVKPPAKASLDNAAAKNVRPDAGHAFNPTIERLQPAKEDMPKDFVPRPAARASVQTAPETAQLDAGQAANYKQMKAVFQKTFEAKLEELDGKIVVLRAKGNDLKGAAKDSWNQKMAELDVKRDTARAKLNKIANSSLEAWNDVKRGAESAWDDLDRAFRDAGKAFPN
jgi:hypothetical protein